MFPQTPLHLKNNIITYYDKEIKLASEKKMFNCQAEERHVHYYAAFTMKHLPLNKSLSLWYFRTINQVLHSVVADKNMTGAFITVRVRSPETTISNPGYNNKKLKCVWSLLPEGSIK